MLRKSLLIISIFLSSFKAFAQIKQEITLNVQSYKIQDGLTSNNINFIFQDYKGFIWIGTWNGLSKYNGYQFTHFLPEPNKKEGIKIGHFISYLKVSDSIYYLAAKIDGLLKLNVNTHELTKVKNSPKSVTTITKDNDGTFWIGTLADGFYHYLPNKNSFIHFLLKPLVKDFGHDWDRNTVNKIAIDKQNDSIIWLGCRSGLYSFNKKNKTLRPYLVAHPSYMHYFALNHISDIQLDDDGNIWAGKFFGGLGKFSIKTNNWEHFFFDPEAFKLAVLNTNIIGKIQIVDKTTLKLSTSFGPMQFDMVTNTFTKYKLLTNNLEFKGDVVNFLYDRDGNQWFANVYQNGVAMASKRLNSTQKIEFPKQQFKYDYYGSIISDMFWSQRYQRYFMTLTNHDGLITYSKDFKPLEQIIIPDNWVEKEPFPISVAEDTEGLIWISDITKRLILYDPKTKKAINNNVNEFKFCNNINRGPNNVLFFETEKGLFKYANAKWELVMPIAKIAAVSNILPTGFYYIQNLTVYFFDFKNNTSKKITDLPSFAIENNNYIIAIFADSKNRVWITLELGGVYQYDLVNNNLKLLSFKDGLNNNLTREVKADKNGNIFLICNGGLYYFNEKKNIFTDLDNLTHQKTNDWYEHALYFSENDEIIVSKDNALYLIHKNTVLQENVNLPVITDLFSHETHFINDFANILIPNNQNDVKLFFSNFDFASAREVVFEYQLEGVNKEWIRLDKGLNQVTFANLKEGNYTFKVRILGQNDGNSCNFKITSIWYKSKLFYFITGFLLLAAIAFTLIYFYKRKTKEKDLQKRVSELKLFALQSQLNPHFLFNCLTSISGLIKTKQYDKSEKILNDFAKLMRSILTNSSKDLITLEEEIRVSKLYLELEKIRKDNTFDYQFSLDKNLNLNALIPPLILQPFLENCIKHGFGAKTSSDSGLINIDIHVEKERIKIDITDNGIGVVSGNSTFNLHQSMGIEIQKERMKQYAHTHNKQITIKTEFKKDIGAKVSISID